jgi:hypothetical protein
MKIEIFKKLPYKKVESGKIIGLTYIQFIPDKVYRNFIIDLFPYITRDNIQIEKIKIYIFLLNKWRKMKNVRQMDN